MYINPNNMEVTSFPTSASINTDDYMESIDKKHVNRMVTAGLDVYEVRAGIRHIGLYISYEAAESMAEFYDANVYDWATGERA